MILKHDIVSHHQCTMKSFILKITLIVSILGICFGNPTSNINIWDNGEMPYEIDKSTIGASKRIKSIENAIASFNKRTCGCLYIRYCIENNSNWKKGIEFVLN